MTAGQPAGLVDGFAGNVVEGFFRLAATAPDAVAVVDDAGQLTYAELAAAARAVSRDLADRVPGRAPVSVELGRGRLCLVAVLGALHRGCPVVLADPTLRDQVDAVGPDVTRLGEQDVRRATANPDPDPTPAAGVHPEALAYVCHTSGSTGRPKWVGVPHRAIVSRLAWGQRTYPLGADDRVLWQAEPTFDFAWWEMLAPLSFGAAVVVADDLGQRDLRGTAERITGQRVSAAHFVPSVLRAYLRTAPVESLAKLRYLFVGGEQFDGELLARLRPLTSVRIFNQYGPSETCVDSTCFDTDGFTGPGPVPIGAAVDGTGLRFFPPTGPAAADVVELGIAGSGLAHGYLGDPRSTADRFVPDPDGPPGSRVYRTGDLVRRLPGGVLEFVGRTDEQVKINGVRVEPEAVRSAVRAAYPDADVAVTTVDEGDGLRLVAFVAGADATTDLAGRLPRAMVPRVVRVDAIPVLPSGKPDLAALLGSVPVGSPASGGSRPLTPTEAQLAKIWMDLLQVTTVLPEDNFFDLGGHSLMATELAEAMEETFSVEVPLREVFDCDSLEQMGELVNKALAAAA